METIRYISPKALDNRGRTKPSFMVDPTNVWVDVAEGSSVTVVDADETTMTSDVYAEATVHLAIQAVPDVVIVA